MGLPMCKCKNGYNMTVDHCEGINHKLYKFMPLTIMFAISVKMVHCQIKDNLYISDT